MRDYEWNNYYVKQNNAHVKSYQANQLSSGGGMDLFGIGSIINAGVNATLGGINYKEQKRQYEKNMKFQREQFEYQKQLNQLQMEREDNAVQRRAKDLNAAGINRLMADGQSAASGGMTSTSHTGTDAAQINMDAGTWLSALLQNKAINNEKAKTQIERERLGNQILDSQQNRMESLSRMIVNAKNVEEKNALIKQYNASANLINKQAEALGINIDVAKWSGLNVGDDPRVNNPYQATSGALIAAAKNINNALSKWNSESRNYTFEKIGNDDDTGNIIYDEKEGEWYEIVRKKGTNEKYKLYANGKRVKL